MIDPKDFDSRLEFSKATSNYHFDPSIPDEESDVFLRIGRFEGDWQDEIEFCLNHTRKIGNSFVNRIGADDPYTRRLDVADLAKIGVSEDWVLFDKYIPTARCKKLRAMANAFGLEDVQFNIHVQMPGQVFFYHVDNLTSLRKNKNETSLMDEPNKAARFGIALQDWRPGHVYGFGNTYWKQWKAGDIVWHDWINTPHGTSNFGHSPRITLQVTGITTEKTLQIISEKNLVISIDSLLN